MTSQYTPEQITAIMLEIKAMRKQTREALISNMVSVKVSAIDGGNYRMYFTNAVAERLEEAGYIKRKSINRNGNVHCDFTEKTLAVIDAAVAENETWKRFLLQRAADEERKAKAFAKEQRAADEAAEFGITIPAFFTCGWRLLDILIACRIKDVIGNKIPFEVHMGRRSISVEFVSIRTDEGTGKVYHNRLAEIRLDTRFDDDSRYLYSIYSGRECSPEKTSDLLELVNAVSTATALVKTYHLELQRAGLMTEMVSE